MKRTISIYILLLVLCSVNMLFAQTKILKPDQDFEPSIERFIYRLDEAVLMRDREFIISILDDNIMNGFGGNGGVEEFKQYWNWDSEKTEFWKVMKEMLRLGGTVSNEGEVFTLPYVFADWPGHEIYDVFEHMVVTGDRVNVRDKPSISNSTILGQFSYDIVRIDYEQTDLFEHEIDWYFVVSLDGMLKGYVSADYLYSPIGYRANFINENGVWKMVMLLAGD